MYVNIYCLDSILGEHFEGVVRKYMSINGFRRNEKRTDYRDSVGEEGGGGRCLVTNFERRLFRTALATIKKY